MSIHEELKVLEEANYQSLDEKRITITAWLVNKVAELEEKLDQQNKTIQNQKDAEQVKQYMKDNYGIDQDWKVVKQDQECHCHCEHCKDDTKEDMNKHFCSGCSKCK